jgi:hypothetical protein
MIKHPLQIGVGSLSVMTASTLLVASGGAAAVLPLIAYGGGLSIASLFVPANASWRNHVDTEKRRELRDQVRNQLLTKIEAVHPSSEGSSDDVDWYNAYRDYGRRYTRMRERMLALRKLAKNPESNLTEHDIERLDNATIDFLRLFYTRVTLRARMANDEGEVDAQLANIEEQLQIDQLSAVDLRRLEQAKQTLEKVRNQRDRLPIKDSAVTAQLLSMSESFEELYHRVAADPYSGSMSDYMAEVTDRLTIEEEMDLDIDAELEGVMIQAKRQAMRTTRG